jgi:chaperone BCS1
VETARRASMSAWNGFVDCESIDPMVTARTQVGSSAFFLTAHFSQDDYPYDW